MKYQDKLTTFSVSKHSILDRYSDSELHWSLRNKIRLKENIPMDSYIKILEVLRKDDIFTSNRLFIVRYKLVSKEQAGEESMESLKNACIKMNKLGLSIDRKYLGKADVEITLGEAFTDSKKEIKNSLIRAIIRNETEELRNKNYELMRQYNEITRNRDIKELELLRLKNKWYVKVGKKVEMVYNRIIGRK